MIIKTREDVPGDNVLEKNENRRCLIKKEKVENTKKIDSLFLSKTKEEFAEKLSKILYQEIPELFLNLIFNRLNKDDFSKWYKERGEEGCFDLIKRCKLY